MNLEELKSAMESAAAELSKAPDDAALVAAHAEAKKAYDIALAESSGKTGDDEDESLDDSKLDERTKKYIEKLRRENGKHRTKANATGSELQALKESLKKFIDGDDDVPAEEQLQVVAAQGEAAMFRAAVLEAAIEHGVGREDREYFEFLVGKRLEEMEEGAELGDEELVEIAKAAKRAQSGSFGAGRSSVDDSKGAPKNPNGGGSVTLDQFVAMSITEKSLLYGRNKALYDQLMAEAKSKRRI